MSESGHALVVAVEQMVLRALVTSDCDALPVPNCCVAASNVVVQAEREELLSRSFINWLQPGEIPEGMRELAVSLDVDDCANVVKKARDKNAKCLSMIVSVKGAK